ncbi:hypothetical protein [Lacticaseibacillus brantae]|uniref:hypothetical protein n=1 Tax=Lacticaseibacillus brantae TaxID=943673 RepID=UPI000710475E|nr:hypothetical protein [Lacticaseibacillus brantae]
MTNVLHLDDFTITRSGCPGGWTKVRHHGETIGLIETDKLFDDLPRILNRPLTSDEQAAIPLLAPRIFKLTA